MLINDVASYLQKCLDLIPGTSLVINAYPISMHEGLLIKEVKTQRYFVSQIDASYHKFEITYKASKAFKANEMCSKAYNALLGYDEDTTGIINTGNYTCKVELCNQPIWEKTDDEGISYYSFDCYIITQR